MQVSGHPQLNTFAGALCFPALFPPCIPSQTSHIKGAFADMEEQLEQSQMTIKSLSAELTDARAATEKMRVDVRNLQVGG